MNIPKNVNIDFPYNECFGCDACDLIIEETNGFWYNLKNEEIHLITCSHKNACSRLINKGEDE